MEEEQVMGKSVNVMVEVDERVYDIVVAPHKKNKSFSKLLRTLLTGYADSSVIREYCNDTFNAAKRSRMEALDEIIGGMQESLAAMGMYSDELKANTQEGIDSMSRAKAEAVDNVENSVHKSKPILGIGVRTDEMADFIGSMTKRTSDLEERMNEISKQTSMIIELLSSREPKREAEVVEDTKRVVKEDFVEEKPLVVISDDDNEVEENTSNADDILQGLLGGMNFEF